MLHLNFYLCYCRLMVSYLVQVELESIVVTYFEDHINITGGLSQLCVLLTCPYCFVSSSLLSDITG